MLYRVEAVTSGLLVTLALCAVLLGHTSAWAQSDSSPAEATPSTPATDDTPDTDDTPATDDASATDDARAPDQTSAPGLASDTDAAARGQLEVATKALLQNRLDEAITLLDAIAQSARDNKLQASAQALADFARRLKSSHARITLGGQSSRDGLSSVDKDSGRTSVVITSTLAAFYSSFALVDVIGINDFTPYTLTVAITTGAGLGASLLATQRRTIRPATASAYSTGLIAGVANGLLLAPKLGISPEGELGDGEVNQNYLLFGLTTMAVGGATGYKLGVSYRPTEAQVTVTSMSGLSGFASMGLALVVLQPDGIDGDTTVPMLLGLGLDAGLVGGALLSRDIDWSASRANYVALSQFLGALVGFTLGAVTVGEPKESGEEKAYAGLMLGGIWAGLLGGVHFTRGMSPDVSSAKSHQAAIALQPLLGRGVQGIALGGSF